MPVCKRIMRILRESVSRLRREESGQSLVLVAISFTVLLGFGALAVDLGASYVTEQKLQNAADEAALAAARVLSKNLTNYSGTKEEAFSYAEQNGVKRTETTVTVPSEGNPYRIEVVCTREISYSFAGVLGKKSGKVSARAVAECQVLGGPFDYAIFSGNQNYELPFNIGSMTVGGSIHSNDDMALRSSGVTVNGSAESVDRITMNGGITINGGIFARQVIRDGRVIAEAEKGRIIDMPDFAALVKDASIKAGTYSSGSKQFNGDGVNVNYPIYVNGDVQFNTPTVVTGCGIIIAKGNITFNAASVLAPGASVCFYSQNGNIQINAGEIRVDGILYAPKGMIQANTSKFIVNGRVVADKLQFNASTVIINQGTHDKDCLPRLEIKLVE